MQNEFMTAASSLYEVYGQALSLISSLHGDWQSAVTFTQEQVVHSKMSFTIHSPGMFTPQCTVSADLLPCLSWKRKQSLAANYLSTECVCWGRRPMQLGRHAYRYDGTEHSNLNSDEDNEDKTLIRA